MFGCRLNSSEQNLHQIRYKTHKCIPFICLGEDNNAEEQTETYPSWDLDLGSTGVTRLKSQTTEDCMLQRREKIGMGFHPFFQKEKGNTLHRSCNQMLFLSYLSQTKILNKPFKSKNGEDIIGLPLISFWDKCLLMKSMISDGKMDMGPGRLVNLAWKPEGQYSLGTKSWRFSSVLFRM